MTVILPAFSSGSMTRSSASKPLSAITMSAAICGSKMSAPSRSQACPGVRVKPVGLPNASTVALILVLIRPCCGRWLRLRPLFLGASAVLMGTHDGRIDHRVFVVGIRGEMLEDPLPDTRLGPASKARMNRLPVSEPLRQVPPGHSSPISVQDRLHEQTIVLGGHAHIPITSRQQILDPIPFVVV